MRLWQSAVQWVTFVLIATLLSHGGTAEAAELREAVEQLATQLAKSLPEGKQLRIAVTDLPDLQGITSDLGRYIAERLASRMIQSGRFRVIERRRLAQVLAELKVGMSDLGDPAKAKQLGKLAGVEALVVGSLSDLGNTVEVDTRIIEVETSNMVVAATTSISKDDTVKAMQGRGVQGPVGTSTAGQLEPGQSSGSPPASAATAGRKEFIHKRLKVEVVSAGLDEKKQTRVALMFTNLDSEATETALRGNDTYIVDAQGKRYNFAASSLPGSLRFRFPPGAPTRVWVFFEKGVAAESTVDLYLLWELLTSSWESIHAVIGDVKMGR